MSRVRTIRRHGLHRDGDAVELRLVRKDGIFGGFNVQESGKGPTRMLSWRWTRESEAEGILRARMRTLQSLGFACEHPGAESAGPDAPSSPAPTPTKAKPRAADWPAAVQQAVAGDHAALQAAIPSLDEEQFAQALGLSNLVLRDEPPPSVARRLAAVLPACRGLDEPWIRSWLGSRSVLMHIEPSVLQGWLADPESWADPLADALAEQGPALLGGELEAVSQSTHSSVIAEAATHWLARMERV